MLGNSSSGLVEAPALDLPAVNVGDRQAGRRREANVLDVPAEPRPSRPHFGARSTRPSAQVAAAHPPVTDGRAGERIARIIAAWHPPSRPASRRPGRRDAVTSRPLVVIGGGEHARVVLEAARARSDAWRVVGSRPGGREPGSLLGVGPPRRRCRLSGRALRRPAARERPAALVLGVGGDPASRRSAALSSARSSAGAGCVGDVVVHPTAWVSPTARLDAGTVVLAGAVVNAGAPHRPPRDREHASGRRARCTGRPVHPRRSRCGRRGWRTSRVGRHHRDGRARARPCRRRRRSDGRDGRRRGQRRRAGHDRARVAGSTQDRRRTAWRDRVTDRLDACLVADTDSIRGAMQALDSRGRSDRARRGSRRAPRRGRHRRRPAPGAPCRRRPRMPPSARSSRGRSSRSDRARTAPTSSS